MSYIETLRSPLIVGFGFAEYDIAVILNKVNAE